MLGREASTDRATTLFPGRGAVREGLELGAGKRVVSRSVLFWFWRRWAGFGREGGGVRVLLSPEEVSVLEELSAAKKIRTLPSPAEVRIGATVSLAWS